MMKKKIASCLMIFLITACSDDPKSNGNSSYINEHPNISIQENNFLDSYYEKIRNLKEVRDKEKEIRKLSKEKRGLTFVLVEKPSAEQPYYKIWVGYNDSLRFETFYQFNIDIEKNKLIYVDVTNNQWIEIKNDQDSLFK